MTSVAVIMILLLVVYINQSFNRMKKDLDEAQNSSEAVKDALLVDLQKMGLPAEKDPNDPLALVIRLHDDSLSFDVAKSIISASGKAYLKHIMPELMQALSSKHYSKDVNALLIEGHTDSDGNDENNLRLSQDRAFEVLRCSMNETGLNWAQRERLLLLASTNGRGERDLLPEGSKPGAENKGQSRRVEFRIRIRSYEQKKRLEDLNQSPSTSAQPAAQPTPIPAVPPAPTGAVVK